MQSRGLATEAVELVAKFAFEQLDLHRIEAGVMPRNKASIRVVEKAGFTYIGLSKDHLKIQGTWEDHNLYALTRESWTLTKNSKETPLLRSLNTP